jgi:hypothetical protein
MLLVLDPLGNIPVLLALLESVPPRRRRWILLRATGSCNHAQLSPQTVRMSFAAMLLYAASSRVARSRPGRSSFSQLMDYRVTRKPARSYVRSAPAGRPQIAPWMISYCVPVQISDLLSVRVDGFSQ